MLSTLAWTMRLPKMFASPDLAHHGCVNCLSYTYIIVSKYYRQYLQVIPRLWRHCRAMLSRISVRHQIHQVLSHVFWLKGGFQLHLLDTNQVCRCVYTGERGADVNAAGASTAEWFDIQSGCRFDISCLCAGVSCLQNSTATLANASLASAYVHIITHMCFTYMYFFLS